MINNFRGKYYFLSNFYPALVSYKGIIYQNNEAAFQSMKTTNLEERKEFEMLDPSHAKSKGRRVSLRCDWGSVKDNVMYEICYAKFSHNLDLFKMLIETGEEELVEGNTWGDKYWGKVNGIGENKLGKILMKIRNDLYLKDYADEFLTR